MNEHDDDNDDALEEVPIYIVDDDTRQLLEVACNCLATLAEAQVNEEAAQGLVTIADALAERFNIGHLDQEIHTTDDGEEEIILKPQGGIFPIQGDDDGDASTG